MLTTLSFSIAMTRPCANEEPVESRLGRKRRQRANRGLPTRISRHRRRGLGRTFLPPPAQKSSADADDEDEQDDRQDQRENRDDDREDRHDNRSDELEG